MINIIDDMYFQSVMNFAESKGLKEQLEEKINRLSTYAENGDRKTICRLYRDFAPHSFSFEMYEITDNGKTFWFNGGLIYQDHENPANGTAPSLTCSLHSAKGWFIHT